MRVAVLCIALVSQFVLAHLLLAEGRGIYALCVLFGMLSGVALTPGADRGAQYFVMSGRMSLSEGLSSAYLICATGSAIALAVTAALVHAGLAPFDSSHSGTLYLAFLLVPAVTTSRTTLRQISGLKRFGHLAAYSVVQAVTTLAATLLMVWGLGLGIDGAIGALLLGHLVSIALGVSYLARHHGLSVRIAAPQRMRPLLRYGFREWAAAVGLAAESMVVALVLGLIAAPAEVGLIALAAAIVRKALVLSDAASTCLAPRVAEDPLGAAPLSAFFIRIVTWTVTALLLLWVALSATAVEMLLPGEFAPVTRLTWILAVGMAVAAPSAVIAAHFRSVDRPEVVSRYTWVGLVSTVLLTLALYPAFGLHGAAWAVTAGYAIGGVFLYAAFLRLTRLPLISLVLPLPSDIGRLRSSTLQVLTDRRPV